MSENLDGSNFLVCSLSLWTQTLIPLWTNLTLQGQGGLKDYLPEHLEMLSMETTSTSINITQQAKYMGPTTWPSSDQVSKTISS